MSVSDSAAVAKPFESGPGGWILLFRVAGEPASQLRLRGLRCGSLWTLSNFSFRRLEGAFDGDASVLVGASGAVREDAQVLEPTLPPEVAMDFTTQSLRPSASGHLSTRSFDASFGWIVLANVSRSDDCVCVVSDDAATEYVGAHVLRDTQRDCVILRLSAAGKTVCVKHAEMSADADDTNELSLAYHAGGGFICARMGECVVKCSISIGFEEARIFSKRSTTVRVCADFPIDIQDDMFALGIISAHGRVAVPLKTPPQFHVMVRGETVRYSASMDADIDVRAIVFMSEEPYQERTVDISGSSLAGVVQRATWRSTRFLYGDQPPDIVIPWSPGMRSAALLRPDAAARPSLLLKDISLETQRGVSAVHICHVDCGRMESSEPKQATNPRPATIRTKRGCRSIWWPAAAPPAPDSDLTALRQSACAAAAAWRRGETGQLDVAVAPILMCSGWRRVCSAMLAGGDEAAAERSVDAAWQCARAICCDSTRMLFIRAILRMRWEARDAPVRRSRPASARTVAACCRLLSRAIIESLDLCARLEPSQAVLPSLLLQEAAAIDAGVFACIEVQRVVREADASDAPRPCGWQIVRQFENMERAAAWCAVECARRVDAVVSSSHGTASPAAAAEMVLLQCGWRTEEAIERADEMIARMSTRAADAPEPPVCFACGSDAPAARCTRGHSLCGDCVRAWVRTLDAGGALHCAVAVCGGQFCAEECVAAMGPGEEESVSLRSRRCADVARLVRCKTRGCAAVFAAPKRAEDAPSTCVECEQCGAMQCWACAECAPHPGISCARMARWRDAGGATLSMDASAEHASASEIARITKPCPRCGVRVEKEYGCLHMTCLTKNGRVGCGYEWCWQCLGPYHTNDGCTASPPAHLLTADVMRSDVMNCVDEWKHRVLAAAQQKWGSIAQLAHRAKAAEAAVRWSWFVMGGATCGNAMLEKRIWSMRDAEQMVRTDKSMRNESKRRKIEERTAVLRTRTADAIAEMQRTERYAGDLFGAK
jgi:hypothetical protein